MQTKLTLAMVFLTLLLMRIHESQASLAKPGCQEICGNVTILYPFGIGSDCYLYESFEVFCSGSSQDQVPIWLTNNQELPILELSTDLMRVIHKSANVCAIGNTSMGDGLILGQYFSFSQDHNLFVAMGCDIFTIFGIYLWDSLLFCGSSCNETLPMLGSANSCTGFNGCCQLSVPKNITSYNFLNYYNNLSSQCSQTFISENSTPIYFDKPQLQLPVALNWVVALTTCQEARKNGDNMCGMNTYCIDSTNIVGYNCGCREGYEGNPYLPDGCQDINSCLRDSYRYCQEGETCVYTHGSYKCVSPRLRHKLNVLVTFGILIGVSTFCVVGYWAYIKLDKIRKNKMKNKFFNKNGGRLLKQQITSTKSCIMTIKLYTAKEMKKATGNFSRSRFLGKGGHGTVYKGLLPDGTVVAIKKSNVIDVDQVERFVNEVFILAQINHKNIVKLLGCCLEYEVPLLVYEYLVNDTLSQHLYDGTERATFSWKDRIRITREVAGALAYLHSYASPTIFHRDIKPNNILLDQNYKAVLSDFGLSRSVPLSRSHLTTQIEGTFGYLDPEYFESGKLTAKSDVYSFGVVLTELLTGKKSNSSSDSGEGLVPRFKYLVKHNQFVEVLDKQVVEEAKMDDIIRVVKLAKRCMNMNSRKRPSMEEVVTDLDKLRVVRHGTSS